MGNCAAIVATLRRRADRQRLTDDATDLAVAQVFVARSLAVEHGRNKRTLERMAWSFTVATAMLALQIALWGVALAVG